MHFILICVHIILGWFFRSTKEKTF